MAKYVGILTAGGDSPGLNAAIRGVGKAAHRAGFNVIGFRDGFRGFMENRLSHDGRAAVVQEFHFQVGDAIAVVKKLQSAGWNKMADRRRFDVFGPA